MYKVLVEQPIEQDFLTRLFHDPAVILTPEELSAINLAACCRLTGQWIATLGRGGHLLLLRPTRNANAPLKHAMRVLPFEHLLDDNRWLDCDDEHFCAVIVLARYLIEATR